jgi:hypothetical protein
MCASPTRNLIWYNATSKGFGEKVRNGQELYFIGCSTLLLKTYVLLISHKLVKRLAIVVSGSYIGYYSDMTVMGKSPQVGRQKTTQYMH